LDWTRQPSRAKETMMIHERNLFDDGRNEDTPEVAEYAEQFRTVLRRAAALVERPWFNMSIAPIGEEPR
jgi:hypothetical protein